MLLKALPFSFTITFFLIMPLEQSMHACTGGYDNYVAYYKDSFRVRFRESEQNNLHKYYLSVSNVAYNHKVKALQMTTRFFIDDLETVLSLQTDAKIRINTNQDLKDLKSELSRYLNKKMELTADGKKRTIDYLGSEIENDQVILYTEIPVNQEPQSIAMKFTALQEAFEDQKNMVHFKLHGQRGTLLMTREKTTDILKLS